MKTNKINEGTEDSHGIEDWARTWYGKALIYIFVIIYGILCYAVFFMD
jgi:hypothetical protein